MKPLSQQRWVCIIWEMLFFWCLSGGTVVKVKGWRTMLVDQPGRPRETITPITEWECRKANDQ